MNTPSPSPLSRRRFLAATGGALAFPLIFPGCATAPRRRVRPSNRIHLGIVGWGLQGPANIRTFLHEEDCRVVAACDIDRTHLQAALDTINGHYESKDCKGYHDYREMLASDDLDAVVLAVPDHWHELVATEAARRGLDIYGEKPLAQTIAEQQSIVRAVQKNKVIWQTGSWQRSLPSFRRAAEIVRSGLLGEITRVEVGLPAGHNDLAKTKEFMTPSAPPAELDYERWIGPSQMEPYIKARGHMNWRWNYNTGGGQLMDWIGHHCDIAHWGLDFDRSGPSEIEAQAEFPAAGAIWNTATKYRIELKYPRSITMTIAGGHSDIKNGTRWIGKDGWVYVTRGGFDASNPEWKKSPALANALVKGRLQVTSTHHRNFLDCIKSRRPTITPVETAHHSAIPGHLGAIAMKTGRKIRWDVASETIIGDPAASKLLSRDYRGPWKLS
jgi:predicted dehydrogenase